MTPRGAIFDLGGVVLDSQLEAIAEFEERHGMVPGTVNGAVVAGGSGGAWARHERGEIDRAMFFEAFGDELLRAGHTVDIGRLMAVIDDSIRARPDVLDAVDGLRRSGVAVAAVTNNWRPLGPDGIARHFDVVVESVVEGVRKPETPIYEICVGRLGVPPARCVMFDDLGPNLKPARAMGMMTVKVTGRAQLLRQIDRHFR